MQFDTKDALAFGDGLQDVWQNTEIGREYIRAYHSDEDWEERFDLIRSTAIRVAGGNTSVNEDEIARALYLLIASGRIKPCKTAAAPIEETPADTRPRDKNGKLLSAAQIQWGEFTRWANDHSSEECRKRAQNDEAFKQFMQTRIRQEMTHEIDGAVTPDKPKTAASPDLESFADAYKVAPAASIRPINGVVTMDGKKYSKAAFDALVDACSAARLIF